MVLQAVSRTVGLKAKLAKLVIALIYLGDIDCSIHFHTLSFSIFSYLTQLKINLSLFALLYSLLITTMRQKLSY